jgi:hypothetical protein
MKNTIPYTPDDWTPDQLAFHRANTMEDALHSATCLAGGWYRRPVTIDASFTEDNHELYMLRPADVAPVDGWTPCYTITAESRTP